MRQKKKELIKFNFIKITNTIYSLTTGGTETKLIDIVNEQVKTEPAYQHVKECYSVERMVKEYIEAYKN